VGPAELTDLPARERRVQRAGFRACATHPARSADNAPYAYTWRMAKASRAGARGKF
jgi:hypothetical protein